MKYQELLDKSRAPYIICEVGITSNGDLNTALQLVKAAKGAGADAIKFMMIDPDYFMSDKSVEYHYEWSGGPRTENMYEMFKSTMYNEDEWFQIKKACTQESIDFMLTINYLKGVTLAEKLEADAYKISSWDVRHYQLIEAIATTQKSTIVDLGPANIIEIHKFAEVFKATGNTELVFMHCSHAKRDNEVNLLNIPYLQDVFSHVTGYSADDRTIDSDLMAIALGARVIEKRLTLDIDYKAHHHNKALMPHEFEEYVERIKKAYQRLGQREVSPSQEDLRQKNLYFVSLVGAENLAIGTMLQKQHLVSKRPGYGISPEHEKHFIDRPLKKELKENELLSWDHI